MQPSPDSSQRLLGSVALLGAGNASQLLLNLVGVAVAVRALTPSLYGVFVLGQLTASLVETATYVGQENVALTRELSASKDGERGRLLGTAFSIRLGLIVAGFIVTLLFTWGAARLFATGELARHAIVAAGYFAAYSLFSFARAVSQAFGRFRRIATAQVLEGIVRLGAIAALVGALGYGVRGLFIAGIVSYGVPAIVMLADRKVPLSLQYHAADATELFRFGLPLAGNNVLSFLFRRVDRFIIAALLSPASLALYEIAAKLPNAAMTTYESIVHVVFPRISRLRGDGRMDLAMHTLGRAGRAGIALAGAAAVITALYSDEITVMLFSPTYAAAAPALALLMLHACLNLVDGMLGSALVAFGEPDKPMKINLIATGANVAANFLLIPSFGIMGAVWATVVTRLVALPVAYAMLRRKAVPESVAIPATLIALAAAGVVLAPALQELSWTGRLAPVALVLALFALLGWQRSGAPRQEVTSATR